MMNKLLKILILSSTLSFISGCGHAASKAEQEKGKTMIDAKNTQDWCLGRYTFKIPKDAKMINESINYDSFKIESKTNANKADFDKAIANKIAGFSDGFSAVTEQTEVITINNKFIKTFWGKLNAKRQNGLIHVYSFVLDSGTLFLIQGTYSEKFKQESRDGIKYLVDNLTARNNKIIPKEKGICFKNGFIKDDGNDYKFTSQKIGYKFANAPSVVITAETEATHTPEEDLVTRTEKNLKKSPNYPKNISTSKNLKKGNKVANPSIPLSGVELVTEVALEGGSGILATWEHAGSIRSATDPLLSITVDSTRTNSYVQASSIPNQNALQVYEAILNSIKKF